MNRTPIIAANWKMNHTPTSARSFLAEFQRNYPTNAKNENCECVIAPPFVALSTAKDAIHTNIRLAAQNVSEQDDGAFTGEISVNMLADIGVDDIIIGHSERRQIYGEDDTLINKKIKKALASGFRVIFCIGETLAERKADKVDEILKRQISIGLTGIEKAQAENIVLAYEPVWAIGTGVNASPEQAQDAHEICRTELASLWDDNTAQGIRILYGGSVKPGNAGDLLSQPDVDGALVGGASLKASDFLGIIKAA